MRALFITWAWRSHYYPMVPFAWALRAAGHEVMVASQPSFAEVITEAGLPALPVGEDIDLKNRVIVPGRQRPASLDDSDEGEAGYASAAERGLRDIAWTAAPAESAAAMAVDTYRFAEHWKPDVVVYEPMAYLGPGLARDLGVPAVRLLWATDFAASIVQRNPDMFDQLGGQLGQDVAKSFGDVTLDPSPPSLQISHDDVVRRPMRYVPYNGPAVLPTHLRTPPARPRIAVTWGGSLFDLGWHDGILGPHVVRALAGHDVEIVIATSDAQRHLYTDLPGNVTHIGPVALHLLLPSCDAIIHQGGAGTTMTAMTTATPQLIMPWAPDAAVNARQIEKTGAGRHHSTQGLDAAALRVTVDAFLTDLPDHRKAADLLYAEHLDMPAPGDVARHIEQLVPVDGPARP
ncbi:nucleotide disphospho-sugar-binding domain-containing protein [Streptomyces sp. NPDC007971]|uniref:nucleotide disphospho-sugar-binding domain-containing protein n=1 Tax=Streptomyces sp. NPDC007971 TaxID=3364799 RepID=UPI0036EF08EF